MTFDVYEPRKPKTIADPGVDDFQYNLAKIVGEASNEQNIDMVNHPPHYTSHPSGVEAIEITRHYDFAIGNAIKYLWRAGLKKDSDQTKKDITKEIEDLEKAIFYINDKIAQLRKIQ
jgi:hypothetical protein